MSLGLDGFSGIQAHNISAADIQASHNQRVANAQAQNAQAATDATTAQPTDGLNEEEEEEESSSSPDEVVATRKRKRTLSAAAIKAQAQAKAKAKAKARRKGQDVSSDEDELLDGLTYKKKPAIPGQLANCDICDKRFTVTAYSKTGPDGGLLCTPCGKQLAADEKQTMKKAQKPVKRARRQNFSNLLDGIAQNGAFSLLEMCVKKVADNINDVEEFGDLPQNLLYRLSQILSKRRVLTPRTLNLFLHADIKKIDIFDCGKLEEDDFRKVFALMPFLERVNFRFAGQLKDSVLEYVMDRPFHVIHLELDACNLVSDNCWQKFFKQYGSQLESLRLSNLDCSLTDETLETLVTHCPNLRRLKLRECWNLSYDSLEYISRLAQLEHLSLDMSQYVPKNHPDSEEPEAKQLVNMLDKVVGNLRSLSLRNFRAATDGALEMIGLRGRYLNKLRFTNNTNCSDRAFARLFMRWPNPPLSFIDLSGTRHLDSMRPDGPTGDDDEEGDAANQDGDINENGERNYAIGLASEGFKALMGHSGSKLQRLDISSCRHVSYKAFEEVFNESNSYPQLRELDISFHTKVDDYLMGCIFRSCPGLKKVISFACFKVRDVKVPGGVAMIGGVNAQATINT
ncbi:hypothetical protein FQN57_004587 [Myotisia sp. PD_48]|nr:hypothetical protein FQN57_004587 [Myotisia sp. PD_48]